MKYSLIFLLAMSVNLKAKEANIGINTIELPDRFNNIVKPGSHHLIATDTVEGAMLSFQIGDTKQFEQHIKIMSNVFKRKGGVLKEQNCSPDCRSFYTEYKPSVASHTKYVYIVKTDSSYYQVEYENSNVDEGREFIKSIFDQMQTKSISYP